MTELEHALLSPRLDDAVATVAITRGLEHVRPVLADIVPSALRWLANRGRRAGSTEDVGVLSLVGTARACGVPAGDTAAIGTRIAACLRTKKAIPLDDRPTLAFLLLAAGRPADAKALLPRPRADNAVWAARGYRFAMANVLAKGVSSPRAAKPAIDAFHAFVAAFPQARSSRPGESDTPRWSDLMLAGTVALGLEGTPPERVAELVRRSIVTSAGS